MITPILEQLIHEGKAYVQTLSLVGGVCILKVAEGKHVVITSIKSSPFFDLPAGTDFNKTDDLAGRCIKQLRISSKLSSNVFMYRWSFRTVQNQGAGSNQFLNVPDSEGQQETVYLTHQGNIYFEWAHNPKLNAFTTNTGTVPPPANPENPPISYGSTFPTLELLNLNDPNNCRIQPFGLFQDIGGGGVVAFNQFQFPINNDTRLVVKNPELNNWAYTFPMVQVQMVVIDGTPGKNFKKTK